MTEEERRERNRENTRKWLAKQPEHVRQRMRERARERAREYRKQHPERTKIIAKNFYERHKDDPAYKAMKSAAFKRYYEKNREKIIEHQKELYKKRKEERGCLRQTM